MNLRIRAEAAKDLARITEINDSAFGQKGEGILVERLRQNEDFDAELSLVAEVDGVVVGHILFYPVVIDSDGKDCQCLALAPMSVLPQFQRSGIGSKLVIEGLQRAKRLGYKSVIVVGHAEYYPRFGFRPASQWGIKLPFEAPDNVFLALELISGELESKRGIVKYPQEFEDV